MKKNSRLLFYFMLLTIISILEIATTLFNGRLITVLENKSEFSVIVKFMCLFFGTIILTMALNYFYELIIAKYIENEKYEKKSLILDNLRYSDASKFESIDSSRIAMRLDSDMDVILNFKMREFFPSIFKIIKTVVMLGIVVFINKYVFFFLLAAIPLMYSVNALSKKTVSNAANENMEENAIYFSNFNRRIENITQIVENGNYTRLDNDFDNVFMKAYKAYMRFVGVDVSFDSIINLVMFGMQIVIMLFAGYQVFNGKIHLGDMSNLFQFSTAVLVSIMTLTSFSKDYSKAQASSDNLNKYIDIIKLEEGENVPDDIKKIDFNISFSFGNKKLYDSLKGQLNRGNVYVIKAENGKGKTTFYKLLSGVLKGKDVDIKIDGKNFSNIDSVEFRKRFVDVVFQTPRTRSKSPSEYFKDKFNIINKNEILNNLSNLNLNTDGIDDFFIRTFDKNFNDLSGGERQLYFIISTVINNKRIQIYDEPTSNLDSTKKKWFLDAIEKIKKEHIIIIISHDKDVCEFAENTIEF